MQDMSDNELDNLFKEAAEGFTPPPDPSAWAQMASMLEKTPVKPAAGFWNWKTISGLTAIGLLAVVGTWYGLTGEGDNSEKSNGKYGSNNATQGVVQEQEEQTQPIGNQNIAAAKSLENKNAQPHGVSEKKSAHHNSNRQREADNSVPAVIAQSLNSGPVSAGGLPTTVQPPAAGISQADSSLRAPDRGERSVAMAHERNSTLPEHVDAKHDSTAIEQTTLPADTSANVTKEQKAKRDKSEGFTGISLKAVVSPDFSSVNFFSAGKTGVNYGLLAGYSFNKRWSVYTGVISSRKYYDSKDVEGSYNWDGHDYPMKELDGDCRIIDIPVNVYYTFFPERSFSVRAGLGFSSYIMKKESYVYCVDNYGQNAYYEQNINGENNEWFKVMNFSVAVSKKLSGRLSAEFEPFVKAPLAGVGEGKVSLVSMGAFFNLRYDLIILK